VPIKGTRIYISDPASHKRGSAIQEIFEKIHSGGRREMYIPQMSRTGALRGGREGKIVIRGDQLS
jgi:hypothetical protein